MSLFGNNNNTQPAAGGLFGQQPQGGSLFGGQQQQPKVGGGLFANTTTTTTTTTQQGSLFGQPQQQQQSLFGQPQQQQPQQQQSLFGQPQQQQQQQQTGGLFAQQPQQVGGGLFAQPQQQQQQQQIGGLQQQQQTGTGQQQQVLMAVNTKVWKDMKLMYQQLSHVKKEHISVERDINVSDNNNKYAHKLVTSLPQQHQEVLQKLNAQISKSDSEIASLLNQQRDLHLQIQETRKTIQRSSLGLKETAQQVKDIQETVNELITEQQDQKQYITNFFYTFTNCLENRQYPRILLPQPFIIKAQERFQLKMQRLQRQIDEVEEILQVEIIKRNDEEELAHVFLIIEQLFKYFNNVTALIYDFHKHYETFRMKVVHLQDQREFGFAQDLNEATKHSLNQENRYFKHLSMISDELEKAILSHDEKQMLKPEKKTNPMGL